MYTELALSGGGIYGVAMLGALKHVHLEPIKHIAGTSVGSLIGALLCVVSVDSIINLITHKHIDLESYNIDETIEHCGLLNQERVLTSKAYSKTRYIWTTLHFSSYTIIQRRSSQSAEQTLHIRQWSGLAWTPPRT